MVINRKCPLCKDNNYQIERWGNRNLYLLKCLNKQTSSSMWVELNTCNRFQQVSVHKPKEKVRMSSYNKSEFEKLQTPFWKMMGLKAKPNEIAYERYLNSKNMTY